MTINQHITPRIPPSTLGSRMRDARTWRGREQAEMAKMLDCSRTTVSNYENGVTTPSKLQVNAWAAELDIDVEWLKTGIIPASNDPNVHPSDYKPVTSLSGYRAQVAARKAS